MHKKWLPNRENIEAVVNKIEAEKLYTRQQAIEELEIAGSIFDRQVRLNSLWVAYGKPVKAGRLTLYPGDELIKQFHRIEDPDSTLRLFDLYYHASDDEILKQLGKTREEVFANGTFLELGGWKGLNY